MASPSRSGRVVPPPVLRPTGNEAPVRTRPDWLTTTSSTLPPPINVLSHGIRVGVRAFLVGYGVRAGILFLLKLIPIAKRKERFRRALVAALTGSESFRFGAFFGLFAFLWKTSTNTLRKYFGITSKLNGLISGSIAGLAILAETPERRVGYAQQMIVRGGQCLYNYAKARGHFQFGYGDTVIFVFASAQIMYAYAVHPQVLDPAFYKFIQRTGPIAEDILQDIRRNVRGQLIDPKSLLDRVTTTHKGTPHAVQVISQISPLPNYLPCEALHASNDSCTFNFMNVWTGVVRKIGPVYATLNFVPLVVLKARELYKKPLVQLLRASSSTLRSTVFLSTFCSSYQLFCCAQHNLLRLQTPLFSKDHRYYYWVFGMLSAMSILLENKNRRSELAMYVLPKGVDAAYRIMVGRGWVRFVGGFEVALFCAGMGIVLAFFQTDPQHMSSLLHRLLRRLDMTIEDQEYIEDYNGRLRRVTSLSKELASPSLPPPSPSSFELKKSSGLKTKAGPSVGLVRGVTPIE